MSSQEIAFIVFGCVFGGAMLGFLLGKLLPDRHLDNDSKDFVKLSTALIATLAALVLGLLVSEAKGTFDVVNNEVMHTAVKTVVLDRVLAQYGPETKEIRAALKRGYSTAAELLLSGDESQQAKLNTPESVARLEGIQAGLRALSPQNEAQRGLQLRAIEISSEMATTRWLMVMQREGSISTPLLVVLVFWLSTIFAAWGVFSPRPLTGLIRVSPGPVREAIVHLGE